MITGQQIKAARTQLGWSAMQLAIRAFGVTTHTVHKAEGSRRGSPPTDAQIAAIQRAFEAAGVEFTDGDEVKLRNSPKRG